MLYVGRRFPPLYSDSSLDPSTSSCARLATPACKTGPPVKRRLIILSYISHFGHTVTVLKQTITLRLQSTVVRYHFCSVDCGQSLDRLLCRASDSRKWARLEARYNISTPVISVNRLITTLCQIFVNILEFIIIIGSMHHCECVAPLQVPNNPGLWKVWKVMFCEDDQLVLN